MAVLNPRIKHTAIDGGTFQNEITERNAMGVPRCLSTVKSSARTYDLTEIVAVRGYWRRKTCGGSAGTNAMRMTCWIVGGSGPGGGAVAVYWRAKASVPVRWASAGGQVLDTVDIENYISVPKTEGQNCGRAESACQRYDVIAIDSQSAVTGSAATEGGLHQIETASGAVY